MARKKATAAKKAKPKAKAKSKPKAATKKKSDKSAKYSFVKEIHDGVLNLASVTRSGEIKIKRTELKQLLEDVFEEGARRAAGGERVRFPVIGALARRDVKPRKAGKGVNPFTGEAIKIKARPASKKPRWSFNKSMKETFANKRHW